MPQVIGYSYEADHHCFGCTTARFGPPPYYDRSDTDGSPLPDVTDSEGNSIHPIFDDDERPCYPDELTGEAVFYDEVCGSCLAVNIRTGDEPRRRQGAPFEPGDCEWYTAPIRCNASSDEKLIDELRRWGVAIEERKGSPVVGPPRVHRLINFHGIGKHVTLSEIAPGALMLRCRHCFQRRLIQGEYTIAQIRADPVVQEFDASVHGGNAAGYCSINMQARVAAELLYEAGFQVDPVVTADDQPYYLVYNLCGWEHCVSFYEEAQGLFLLRCMHGCPDTAPAQQFSRLVAFGVALSVVSRQPDVDIDEVRVCEPLFSHNADGMGHVWISPAQHEADHFNLEAIARSERS